MMITIRKITIDEVATIQQLATQIWHKVYPSIISKAQIEYMLKIMYDKKVLENDANRGVQFYIAEKSGEALGFCAFEEVETQIFKLHKLYVQPETKGLNIGTQLVQLVENLLIQNGGGKLILNVNKNNNAVQFYQKRGFKIESEGVFDIGQGYVMDDYIMTKQL